MGLAWDAKQLAMHIEEDNEGSPPDRHGYIIHFVTLRRNIYYGCSSH